MTSTRRRTVFAHLLLLVLALAACESSTEPLPLGTAVDLSPALGPSDVILEFDFTSDGTMWVRTDQGRVLEVRDDRTTIHDLGFDFDGAVGLGRPPARDLFIDSQDRVWVTTVSSWSVWDGTEWTLHRSMMGTPFQHPVAQIAVNHRDEIALAMGNTEGGGVWLHDADGWRWFEADASGMPTRWVTEIAVGPDGAFWLATGQFQGRGGLLRMAGGAPETVLNGKASGLLYATPDRISVSEHRVYLGFEAVFYLTPDRADGGLQSYDLGAGTLTTRFPMDAGRSSNRVTGMVLTRDGELWFTTEGFGECDGCISRVGWIDPSGRMELLDLARMGLAEEAALPWIVEDHAGNVHFATARGVVEILR